MIVRGDIDLVDSWHNCFDCNRNRLSIQMRTMAMAAHGVRTVKLNRRYCYNHMCDRLLKGFSMACEVITIPAPSRLETILWYPLRPFFRAYERLRRQ